MGKKKIKGMKGKLDGRDYLNQLQEFRGRFESNKRVEGPNHTFLSNYKLAINVSYAF
jgi:hypothetical protein